MVLIEMLFRGRRANVVGGGNTINKLDQGLAFTVGGTGVTLTAATVIGAVFDAMAVTAVVQVIGADKG